MSDTSFWKGKKVLITGHTGFKGSWMSILLSHLGADVLGYGLAPHTEPSLFKLSNIETHVKSVIGDIRDISTLRETMNSFKPEIIIHMAAQTLVRESYNSPLETYEVNVMGTINVLENVRYCDSVKTVLNVTTDKVYENKEWSWGYRETDRLGGYDPYSNSKACSELVTSSYVNSFFNPDLYKSHGVAIATARAGNVIGGGDWANDRLIPDVLRAINNDESVYIRNPQSARPWQHVLDPLKGYLMLCEKLFLEGSKWNGAWNFGPVISDSKSVIDIVKYLKTIHPKYFTYTIASEKVLHETNLLNLDSTKAYKILKWEPKWNTEVAIDKIVEWDINQTVNNIYELCIKQIDAYLKD